MALGLLEEKLQKAILDAYTEATFAQMLRFRLDRDLANLATGKSFDEVVFGVIQKAERQGWLISDRTLRILSRKTGRSKP